MQSWDKDSFYPCPITNGMKKKLKKALKSLFHVKRSKKAKRTVTKKETNKQKVGRIGEDVACKFLTKHGFKIIERNYLKKWGEIDIIAEKSGILHFVEVKTVSVSFSKNCLPRSDSPSGESATGVSRENIWDISRETDEYRPEENIHSWKVKRLSRVIQTYLLEKKREDKEWQFDMLAVFLDLQNKEAKIRFSENIIL